MESPKVSIIVPVYNVENFVQKCLQSIENQAYHHLEVLLIDDGSTDASGQICDQFAKKKTNWHVVHQKNQGLSVARNNGISLASGDYIYFLDSDDFIHPQTILLLVETALVSYSEVIEADYFECEPYAEFPNQQYSIKGNIEKWDHNKALTNMLLNHSCSIMACNKLIKSDLLNKVRFPPGKTHEDEFTIPFIVEQVTSYTRLYLPLYAYVQHDNSIMHQAFSRKKLDAIEALQIRYEYFTSKHPNQYDEIVGYALGSLSNKFLILYSNSLDAYTKQKLQQTAKFAFKHVLNPSKLPIQQKLSFYFQRVMPGLFWKIVLYFENKG